MKRKHGVSLIVLAITILVMFILASVIIISFKDNNTISRAKELALKNDIDAIKEELQGKYTVELVSNDIDVFNGPAEDYLETAKKFEGKFEINGGKLYLIQDKANEKEKKAAKDLGINFAPTIPNGFIASDIEGENIIENGLVIYEGTEKVSTDTDAKTTRNQFVWVPVDNIADFVREDGYYNKELQIYVSSGNTTEPYASSSTEVAEYNDMYESVEKYGGFYIGRYEASLSSEGKAQSIALQTPCNNLKWGDSPTAPGSDGQVGKSRAIYPISSATTNDPVSTLVYGVQWDATISFLEKNYPGISKDSSSYGNYKDTTFTYTNLSGESTTKEANLSAKIPTGSTEYTKTNNIYDMCGNLEERTMEAYGQSRFIRGGNSQAKGTATPISFRLGQVSITDASSRGFRIAIYVK